MTEEKRPCPHCGAPEEKQRVVPDAGREPLRWCQVCYRVEAPEAKPSAE